MAIVRTVLPRTGLVQPQHGLTSWETDNDANLALLDSTVVQTPGFADLIVTAPTPLPAGGLFTVAHGFTSGGVGAKPNHCHIRQCGPTMIWSQYPTDMDTVNLYLVASAPGAIAKVTLW